MRKVAAVLLMVVAFTAVGKEKDKKKSKHFEPVTVTAAEAAGTYRGPAESYRLVLELDAGGSLRGTYTEMGRTAVLESIEMNGPELTARARFEDGTVRTLHCGFAIRELNGVRSFGLRVDDVPVEGNGLVKTFFVRL